MKKAVLLSIQPKWCELIAVQRKTVEIRKSRPSVETPFKVYIYQTKGKQLFSVLRNAGMTSIAEILDSGLGMVVGELICDKIDRLAISYINGTDILCMTKDTEQCAEEACLTWDELLAYGNGKPIYGWHISDLRIYDTPKPLSDFNSICTKKFCTDKCKHHSICDYYGRRKLECAPQSYCFVEELP